MRRVTYSMNPSLDGYITDADGGLDWGAPSDEVFRFHIDQIRGVDVHLLGRKLYETMLYWEDADRAADFDDAEREWAALWSALPKVVFSRTLAKVKGNARLATGSLDGEIERMKSEPGSGVIAIGGANLAAQAAELDLIDEYRMVVQPVLVGGGTPYFHGIDHQTELELVETRTFDSGAVYLRHRVVR